MLKNRVCPECYERLSPDARQCACGWKEGSGAAKDPFHGKCTWVDGGDRCRFPGSMSSAVRAGSDKWLCAFHFFNNGGGVHAARIVQNSFDWDGTPESYFQMRKAAASRPRVDVRQGSERVEGVPQSIRELVQNLRVSRHEAEAESGDGLNVGYQLPAPIREPGQDEEAA